jgi:hypothetical protein
VDGRTKIKKLTSNFMRQFKNLQVTRQGIRVLNTITVILLFTVLTGCATGSYILTGKTRPAIDPMAVKVYLTPPTKYETIAIVEASSNVEFSSQAAQNRTIEKLKEQAAKLGANGVLLTNTENKSSGGVIVSGIYIASDKKTARGEAIYVIQE